MILNGRMAKATKSRRRRRNVPISLSSTDTYTAAEYLTSLQDDSVYGCSAAFFPFHCLPVADSAFLQFLGEKVGRVPDLDTMMV